MQSSAMNFSLSPSPAYAMHLRLTPKLKQAVLSGQAVTVRFSGESGKEAVMTVGDQEYLFAMAGEGTCDLLQMPAPGSSGQECRAIACVKHKLNIQRQLDDQVQQRVRASGEEAMRVREARQALLVDNKQAAKGTQQKVVSRTTVVTRQLPPPLPPPAAAKAPQLPAGVGASLIAQGTTAAALAANGNQPSLSAAPAPALPSRALQPPKPNSMKAGSQAAAAAKAKSQSAAAAVTDAAVETSAAAATAAAGPAAAGYRASQGAPAAGLTIPATAVTAARQGQLMTCIAAILLDQRDQTMSQQALLRSVEMAYQKVPREREAPEYLDRTIKHMCERGPLNRLGLRRDIRAKEQPKVAALAAGDAPPPPPAAAATAAPRRATGSWSDNSSPEASPSRAPTAATPPPAGGNKSGLASRPQPKKSAKGPSSQPSSTQRPTSVAGPAVASDRAADGGRGTGEKAQTSGRSAGGSGGAGAVVKKKRKLPVSGSDERPTGTSAPPVAQNRGPATGKARGFSSGGFGGSGDEEDEDNLVFSRAGAVARQPLQPQQQQPSRKKQRKMEEGSIPRAAADTALRDQQLGNSAVSPTQHQPSSHQPDPAPHHHQRDASQVSDAQPRSRKPLWLAPVGEGVAGQAGRGGGTAVATPPLPSPGAVESEGDVGVYEAVPLLPLPPARPVVVAPPELDPPLTAQERAWAAIKFDTEDAAAAERYNRYASASYATPPWGPIRSREDYAEAKQAFESLWDLYHEVHQKYNSAVGEIEALGSSCQMEGISEAQRQRWTTDAWNLGARKGPLIGQWQRIIANVASEVVAISTAAREYRQQYQQEQQQQEDEEHGDDHEMSDC